jgi:hypothetical protein
MDFDGSASGNQLGFAVAPGGDVDGDGYADLLAGEPFADEIGADSGIAHVYLGGATPFTDVVDFTPTMATEDVQFGRTLTTLGDPEGVGRSWVAVGRISSPAMQTTVDVFKYTMSMQSQAELIVGYEYDDFCMSGAVDVDADTSPDLVLGLPSSAGGDGQVWVYGPFILHAPLPPAPHARVTNTFNHPIALRGPVHAGVDLRFQARAWLPIGRTPLRLQWEIYPERRNYLWDGFGPWTPASTHIGGTDLIADEDVSLATNTRFAWRVRVQARNPYVPFGHWWTGEPNAHTLYALRTVSSITAVEGPSTAGGASAMAAVPNPFNPRTRLEFRLGRRADVTLTIFDMAGRRVRRIDVGALAPGAQRIEWDGTDDSGCSVASGVYHAVMRAGDDTRHLKLTLVK